MSRVTINLPQERVLNITNTSTGTVIIRRLSNQPGEPREADSPLYSNVNLAASRTVQIGPYTASQRYVIVGPQEAYTYSIDYEPLSHNHQATGLINGGLLSINTESFSKNPVLDDTNLRAFLVVRKDCTDLSDTSKAVFVNADKYGQVAAEGASFNIPSGIATVTSTAKTSNFNVNLNKAYRIDNSSSAIQGTLAAADDDHVGCIAECWIMSSPATNSVTIRGQNDTDTINGVTGTASNPAVATFNSATTGYKMFRVTVIDENEYLIDSPDSVST